MRGRVALPDWRGPKTATICERWRAAYRLTYPGTQIIDWHCRSTIVRMDVFKNLYLYARCRCPAVAKSIDLRADDGRDGECQANVFAHQGFVLEHGHEQRPPTRAIRSQRRASGYTLSMRKPADISGETSVAPDQQPPGRVVGTRQSPPPGRLPSAVARAAMDANARYRTRVPKGVFFYRNHQEMARDREQWTIDAMVARQTERA